MVIVLGFAFVAGLLTILAPCILPVVPFVLGAGATGGRGRTLGLLAGFGFTFVATTVVLASTLAAVGLTTDRLRDASAVALGLVGLVLAIERLGAWAAWRLERVRWLGSWLVERRTGDGLTGGLVLGAAIGLIWAPCVGPIMAGVIAVAATHGPSPETVAIAVAYVAGAAVPIGLVARLGGRARRAPGGPPPFRRLRRGFGLAMVASAILVVTGMDLTVEKGIAGVLPAGWSSSLLGVEQRPDVQEELDMLRIDRSATPRPPASASAPAKSPDVSDAQRAPTSLPNPVASTLPAGVTLDDLGPAPELTGIAAWINSEPLTIASLRGKVVLVEFWTFGCINCIHVQPYVKAWYDRYASAGLVVIGVHTPELSFERDLGNVRDAVTQADIRFPVAFDPSFATWNAYRNGYWPAFYFIDKAGRIRHTHIGEGDYDGSEQVLRQLLAGAG